MTGLADGSTNPQLADTLAPGRTAISSVYHPLVKAEPLIPKDRATSKLKSQSIPDAIFRLLTLQAGTGEDEIRCFLTTVSLRDKPNYETLSYVWGLPKQTARISCNGTNLSITESLLHALQYLRQDSSDRVIWIDQICINQTDYSERSQQVRIMDLIYRASKRTIIYLESRDPDMGQEMSTMKFPSVKHLIKENLKLWASYVVKSISPTTGDVFKSLRHNPKMMILDEFLSNPWFSRVWIVQEFAVSKDVVFVFHSHEITSLAYFDAIAAYWEGIISYRAERPEPLVIMRHRVPIWRSGQITALRRVQMAFRRGTKTLTLRDLLRETRLCLATDAKDKVFAMVALSQHFHPHNVDGNDSSQDYHAMADLIDYDESLPATFTKAAKHIIFAENSLQLLYYKEGISKISGLPSWVPDWTLQTLFPLNHLFDYKDSKTAFIAPVKLAGPQRNLGWSQSIPGNFTSASSNAKLTVYGWVLDTVEHIGMVWEASETQSGLKAVFSDWRALCHDNKELETPIPLSKMRVETQIFTPGFRGGTDSSAVFWTQLGLSERLRTTDEPYGNSKPIHHPMYHHWKKSRYRWRMRFLSAEYDNATVPAYELHSSLGLLSIAIDYATIGRRLASTKDKYIALVPAESKAEDLICYLEGAGIIPFVLRKETEGYSLVGACYVHGFFTPGIIWAASERLEFVLS